MDWDIVVTDRYRNWFLSLTDKQQVAVHSRVKVLMELGPKLGRPYVDSIKLDKKFQCKELRIQASGKPIRVFFRFDPERICVLLCGGSKDGAGDKSFYKSMLQAAADEYQRYLQERLGD